MFSKEKIESFTKLTLTVKGMRSFDVYEIICTGPESEISHYTGFYTRDDSDRELNKRVSAATEEITALMNEFGLMKWDGFCGANPKHIRDGYMFSLTAQVNGGRTIRATGSNNYPRHYREFKAAITGLLYNDKE